jgi:hypothetical protein
MKELISIRMRFFQNLTISMEVGTLVAMWITTLGDIYKSKSGQNSAEKVFSNQ